MRDPVVLLQFHKKLFNELPTYLKFMFSKKAAKSDEIFTVDLTLCSR